MKVTSIIFTTMVAVASVEALATPQQEAPDTDVDVILAPDAHAILEYCTTPGQPCDKMKRAADAAANAVAEPFPVPDASHHIWCWRPGQPCNKAKRDALALAEAVADAHASANPEAIPSPDASRHIWCWRPGQPCNKAKRDALAFAEAVADAHAAANPEAEAEACKSIPLSLSSLSFSKPMLIKAS